MPKSFTPFAAAPCARARLRMTIGMSVCVASLLVVECVARAEAPSPELMAKLAAHAANFERMRTQASYAIDGRMEAVDGQGAPNGDVREMNARVEADGFDSTLLVDRYIEDGDDKTLDARKKAAERKRDPDRKKKQIRMPMLNEEQARYTFDITEVDAKVPTRVKLAFVPRVRDERAIEGAAWVDTVRGTVLSAGFKLAQTSMFVRYINVQLVFGAETSLGPAVSKVEFEGEGGLLFVRKHFRGTATLSRYRVLGPP